MMARPKQQPVVGPERTTVPPGVLLDLVGDHLGGPPAKLDHLSPVKIIGGPWVRLDLQLIVNCRSRTACSRGTACRLLARSDGSANSAS